MKGGKVVFTSVCWYTYHSFTSRTCTHPHTYILHRLFANALQGMLFAVVWRYLEESQILFGGK